MLDILNKTKDSDMVMLVGRVLLALVYFLGALNWLITMNPPIGFIASKGLPAAALLGWLALIFKLGGSIMLIVGFKTRIGAAMLVVFTIITAFVFHTPAAVWPIDGTFLKELCMIGGLLILMTTGPGKYSLDGEG